MTREEAKELLPVIQAFAEGKIIEFLDHKGKWRDMEEIEFAYATSRYRVKPEPKYRPFESLEECWNEMLKHKPFGWLKTKGGVGAELVCSLYTAKEVRLILASYEQKSYSASDFFNGYVFADGTPFGIKEDGL